MKLAIVRWPCFDNRHSVRFLWVLVISILCLSHAAPASIADGPTTVRVVAPERSLQFMSVWIAEGAGYFREEGLNVWVSVAPDQPLTSSVLLQGEADVAVLPPPMYLQLIAQGQPIKLFANLLRNDPINLVVRRDVAEARSLSPAMTLDDRLAGLSGLRLGIAPGPPTRLRALFASVGRLRIDCLSAIGQQDHRRKRCDRCSIFAESEDTQCGRIHVPRSKARRPMSDPRVEAAIANWTPRFIAQGVGYNDFVM